VQKQFNNAQENQVKSAMGFHDFTHLIHKENQAFDNQVQQENENLVRLNNQLIGAQKAAALCKAPMEEIMLTLELATQDFQAAEATFTTVQERLVGEIELFADVYRVYSTQVGSQSQGYKQKIQGRIDG
jgi:dynactin complex subunit